jgi:hypothetical protein
MSERERMALNRIAWLADDWATREGAREALRAIKEIAVAALRPTPEDGPHV